jgi:hypothetical protein
MTTPAPSADPTTPPAAPAEPAPAAGGTQQEPGTGQPTGKGPQFTGEFDPERAARAIEAARGDAAAEKAKRQRAEQESAERWKAIAKALGLGDDGKPDPAQLTEQLTTAQADARQRSVELAVYKAAGRLGGNPDALLDSRTFLAGVAGLDPADPGFAAGVEQAITAALAANPLLKTASGADSTPPPAPAGRSGGEFNGGPGGAQQVTEAELKHMTPDQIVEARKAGRLKSLL